MAAVWFRVLRLVAVALYFAWVAVHELRSGAASEGTTAAVSAPSERPEGRP
jgi:hypothetical protein